MREDIFIDVWVLNRNLLPCLSGVKDGVRAIPQYFRDRPRQSPKTHKAF